MNSEIRFICQRMKQVSVNKFLEEKIFQKLTSQQRCFRGIELGRRDECIKLYRISIRWPKRESSDILHEECADGRVEYYIKMNVFSMKKFDKERKNISIHFRYNVKKISVHLCRNHNNNIQFVRIVKTIV